MKRSGDQPFHTGAPANPFSSERVRPGALPFLMPEGVGADCLLDRFTEAGRRGQIVGPEGVGKSTLLAALARVAKERGWNVTCASGAILGEMAIGPAGGLLLLDCAEMLPWRRRRGLFRQCDRAGVGLIAATHRDLGLPTLWQPAPNLALARRVVDLLVGGLACEPPSDRLLANLLARHAGNLRFVLFDLYDWYEENAGKTIAPQRHRGTEEDTEPRNNTKLHEIEQRQ